jgi:hypothetical protein
VFFLQFCGIFAIFCREMRKKTHFFLTFPLLFYPAKPLGIQGFAKLQPYGTTVKPPLKMVAFSRGEGICLLFAITG